MAAHVVNEQSKYLLRGAMMINQFTLGGGAEIGNILRFEQDFPGATVVRLEQNYRSTPHILGAASELIQHNTRPAG